MKFSCPHCQTSLEADDSLAGATVDCPTCGQSLLLPSAPRAPRIIRISQTTEYKCPHCGMGIVADAPIEGMQVNCPSCGKVFVARQDKPVSVRLIKPQPNKKRTFGVVQIVAAVLFALQAKFCFDSFSNRHSHHPRSVFLTADGHRRVEAVPWIKAFSAIAYGVGMIPGIGPVVWIPAFGIGFGANLLSNVVQDNADEEWNESQQRFRDAGIDPWRVPGSAW